MLNTSLAKTEQKIFFPLLIIYYNTIMLWLESVVYCKTCFCTHFDYVFIIQGNKNCKKGYWDHLFFYRLWFWRRIFSLLLKLREAPFTKFWLAFLQSCFCSLQKFWYFSKILEWKYALASRILSKGKEIILHLPIR